MKKKVFGKKLSRERATREALFVSLVESLLLHKKIKTTKAKAKSIVGLVDHLVALAKKSTLASKRQALKKLRGNKKAVDILFKDVAEMSEKRNGGFVKIIPLVPRKGDMAQMVRLEWMYEDLSAQTKRN